MQIVPQVPNLKRRPPLTAREATAAMVGRLGVLLLTLWGAHGVHAAPSGNASSASGIYSCTDAHGRRITSDRPIPDCLDREQRLLNKDGSQRKAVPPRQSLQERLQAEEAERERERAEQALQAAIRRDRKLVQRYPNEAAHSKARELALDDVRDAMARSELRVKTLQKERRALLNEAEFYKGKPMPFKLKTELEGNEATQAAQNEILANHVAEIKRLNAAYDAELARLKQLWAGAAPGSLPTPKSAP